MCHAPATPGASNMTVPAITQLFLLGKVRGIHYLVSIHGLNIIIVHHTLWNRSSYDLHDTRNRVVSTEYHIDLCRRPYARSICMSAKELVSYTSAQSKSFTTTVRSFHGSRCMLSLLCRRPSYAINNRGMLAWAMRQNREVCGAMWTILFRWQLCARPEGVVPMVTCDLSGHFLA